MNVFEDMKTEALSLGFFALGCSPAYPVPDYPIYMEWVNNEYHADMNYLGPGRRLQIRRDPGLLLPNCKTIISLGYQYDFGCTETSISENTTYGYIAAYARDTDYHSQMSQKIIQFSGTLKRILGAPFQFRGLCDNAPILERSYGRQSGLGWIGKNSSLLNPKFGSHFFLAELLLNRDLELDTQIIPDRCGTCNRCVDACPTGCILPGRIIDSRKCLSYLTIENKKGIPVELRGMVGSHIFGCDICQSVCPWNNRSKNHSQASAMNPKYQVDLDLEKLMLMSPEEFSKLFHNTPVSRVNFRSFKRNIITAIGNTRNDRFIPLLKKALMLEIDTILMDHLYWSLNRLICDSGSEYGSF